ncbi:hypothetical protein BYT27DRAFT_7187290 [Phlegmacium glaucopus]|nr:hypothetical protein BYT27DRAFT_7187290 [Phlegmacium glaucopus]
MSRSLTRLRMAAVLRLTVLLCCWLRTNHSVFAANITVKDTDPTIVYSPLASWYPSSNLCSTCLDAGISTSYHEVIHPAVNHDQDDNSTSSSSIPTNTMPIPSSPPAVTLDQDNTSTISSSTPTTPSPIPPSSTPPPAQISSPPNLAVAPPTATSSSSSPSITPGGRDSSDDSSGGRGKNDLRRQLVPRLDIDDPGFVDTPITVSFNFTGSAIYIFCIQPPVGAAVNGTPTNMNLSFTLDNQPSGTFFSPGNPGSTGFLLNQSVLSLSGLSDEPHQLVVNVGDDSVFLFDRFIYTDNSTTSPPTADNSKVTKKHNNIGTFGGAVGGSVGVLSLFSLGIAISIIRRRMLAARRDRLDNEAQATGDAPLMSGPVPFVPRYFPDTIIPPDPPTYDDALSSTNHNNTPALASLSSSEYPSRQRSYADIPPASPPPILEDIPPPPPFPLALSVLLPALPSSVIPPSITVANQASSNPDIVGNGSSNFTSSSENLPLLQSSYYDMRPRSRMSTSSLEPSENPETNHHQEDTS